VTTTTTTKARHGQGDTEEYRQERDHPSTAIMAMDGAGGLALLKIFAPQIPGLAYAALRHATGSSVTSAHWDFRTEMTVSFLRKLITSKGGAAPQVGKIQAMSKQDRPVKGKIWTAKSVFAKPAENDVQKLVLKAVEDMKLGEISYTKPESADIPFEWTGYRSDATDDEPLPKISEEEKYKRLMKEPTRSSATTILYFHGGAYYLCGAPTHRGLCAALAKGCKGRVVSVEYRLAPQTAFPGQLLDAFTSYLSLLYPPPGSFHEAVRAKEIVLGGDSAGGNLSMALLQLLLQLHRSSSGVPVVKFHGRDVHVPLPAGCSANSGWLDVTRSFPSITSNADFDYLPGPDMDDAVSEFPADDIWPTNPPRGDLFCDLSLLDHPLVSPVTAADWSQSPPLWMCAGREMLYDEVVSVASRAAQQGVKVQFELYEAMPHCFQLLMPWRKNSERCFADWGEFARKCVEDPQSLKTFGRVVKAKGGLDDDLDVKTLGTIGLEEARRLTGEAKERRLKGYEKEGKAMPKPSI
jgi:acetyl esterase/lipase